MSPTKLRFSALALVAVSGLVAALPAFTQQPDGSPRGRGGPGGLQALIGVLDADQDSEISPEEIENAPMALLSLDKNMDGTLGRDELPRPGRPGGPGGPGEGSGPGALKGTPVGGPPGLAPPTLVTSRSLSPALTKGGGPGGSAAKKKGGGRGGPGGIPGGPPQPPLLSALDKDRDGTLSSQEIATSAAALKTLDKDGDGKLSQPEFRGRPPGGPPPG